MQVTPKQEPVGDLMVSLMGIWTYMRCFQNRKRLLAGDCTTSLVSICHQNSERSLSEPRMHELGRSEPIARDSGKRRSRVGCVLPHPYQPFLNLLPQVMAGF